ncbi:hypothetical protein EVJ58_g9239 [Rhodofomes roseus]|uniref:Uncharacterized protein n=1 Tax=Rhodofomes roseus TaxID=34475 RepID=A0A4Y9XUR5_9APHY|nr:hypothetical protein EVJ58_g9239 [Rhodofomes roseus]
MSAPSTVEESPLSSCTHCSSADAHPPGVCAPSAPVGVLPPVVIPMQDRVDVLEARATSQASELTSLRHSVNALTAIMPGPCPSPSEMHRTTAALSERIEHLSEFAHFVDRASRARVREANDNFAFMLIRVDTLTEDLARVSSIMQDLSRTASDPAVVDSLATVERSMHSILQILGRSSGSSAPNPRSEPAPSRGRSRRNHRSRGRGRGGPPGVHFDFGLGPN